MSIALKYFLILTVIFLIIFNWGYISWFFNYNTIGENISYLARKTVGENNFSVYFSNMPDWSALANSAAATTEEQEQANPVDFNEPVKTESVKPTSITGNETGYLTVSGINIGAPILFTTSQSQKTFAGLLKKGVLHYPGSAVPGEPGAVIILGHSAPPNWPKINYDSVFNNLNNLKQGDEILVNFQGQNFTYSVNRIFWVNKGEDLTPHLTINKSVVVLISCWPPGHNVKRIVVEAEQASTNNK